MILGLMGGLALSSSQAAVGDPVGYVTFKLIAGRKGAMALPMAAPYRIFKPVVDAGADYVEFGVDVPEDLMGTAQSACLDVRDGEGAGQSLKVTGFAGRRVNFEAPAVFPITPGTTVAIRPNWSLGEVIDFTDIQKGETYQTADLIGLHDPATQSTREFFYKIGDGWREVGHEAEGDASATPIPYRSSVQFLRRGASDLFVVLMGTVPMFDAPHHWVRVWPGRNLLTTPFSPADRVDHLFDKTSLISGRSAPHSDSFRIVYADAYITPILYHHESRGWTSIGGGSANAADLPVDFYVAMDFQHVGTGAYLKFPTDFPQSAVAVRALASTPEVVPVDSSLSDFRERKLGWRSEAGTRYQVQTRATGSDLWSDHGEAVVASGEICQAVCSPEGNGIFRIIVR